MVISHGFFPKITLPTRLSERSRTLIDNFLCKLTHNIAHNGQFHVTTDTTQKNKSSYAEYLVLVLYCTHITCHGFKGNMQIQLNNYEISPFAQLCEKL